VACQNAGQLMYDVQDCERNIVTGKSKCVRCGAVQCCAVAVLCGEVRCGTVRHGAVRCVVLWTWSKLEYVMWSGHHISIVFDMSRFSVCVSEGIFMVIFIA